MAQIEGEIVIGRPVEEVFDFVADERNEPRFNSRMLHAEKLSPGPIGVGTRFRAEMRGRRRPVPMTIEFTRYESPHHLASTTHLSTMEIRGELTFESVPEGTRMRWEWNMDPRGLLNVLGPLIARMGRGQEQAPLKFHSAAPSGTGRTVTQTCKDPHGRTRFPWSQEKPPRIPKLRPRSRFRSTRF